SGPDRPELRAAALDHEGRPTVVAPKQGARRHGERVLALPDDKPGLHAVAVSESLPVLTARPDVGDDEDALFLDAEGADLGEARGLHDPHHALEHVAATPALE